MKNLYLVLAIIGTLVPYLFFIEFITVEGVNLSLFITQLFATDPAAGFTADLLITSVVFWIFMFHQLRKPRSPKPYLFIVLNLTIGLSCALPAYLYARERTESVPDENN